MTKTASLAELILMAQAGKKFKAWKLAEAIPSRHSELQILQMETWLPKSVTATWHYEEIKEPLKVSFECGWDKDDNGYFPVDYIVELSQLVGKRTKVTIEEIL